jgi:putative ABC transport system ATP-binding protein
MNEQLLIIRDLEKTYHTKSADYPVLQKVNMSVNKGEFVAVMGPSGSGKTTLLNIISGFLSADAGEIKLKSKDLLSVNKDEMADIRQTSLGFIFQDFMLIDGLTTKENIYLPQIIAGRENTSMNKTTETLMEKFGISNIGDKYPSEISGGQKQRVAISRALSNSPLLILADEPTGNLDSKSSAAVIDAFLTAKEELGATILMVTHDAVAASHVDRVVALADGQVIRELKRETTPRDFMEEILQFMGETEGSHYDA